MKNTKNNLNYLMVPAIAFLVSLTCSPLEVDLGEIAFDNPLKIGLMVPLSVDRTDEGIAFLATNLATEEINRQGGVLGRDLQIVFVDDGGLPEQGVEGVIQLKKDGIDLLIGPAWSSVTLAITRQFTIANGMLVVSHSATSPQVSHLQDNNLVWRTAPSDAFQGRIGADFVFNRFNKKTVGILFSTNAYATDLSGIFRNAFEEMAGNNSILSFVAYPEILNYDAYDFTPHLDELFAGKPDAIYFTSFTSDAIKMTNDIFEGGYLSDDYKPLFFSNDGAFGDDFIFNGNPEILEGMTGTQPTGAVNDPNFILFSKNFINRFGFDPVPFNEHVYDAVYLIAYAILKSGSTTPQNIASELRNVSGGDPEVQGTIINVNEFEKARNIIENGGIINYNGASGLIDFDANGDPSTGTYKIWKIVNGEVVIIEIVIFP